MEFNIKGFVLTRAPLINQKFKNTSYNSLVMGVKEWNPQNTRLAHRPKEKITKKDAQFKKNFQLSNLVAESSTHIFFQSQDILDYDSRI